MAPRPEIGRVIAENLQRLMASRGLSQAALSKKTGIGQSTLSTLLQVDRPLEVNPRAQTLSRLADFFEIAPWQLLCPDLTPDLMQDPQLDLLLHNYAHVPPEARRTIHRVAEAEARYAADHSAGQDGQRTAKASGG